MNNGRGHAAIRRLAALLLAGVILAGCGGSTASLVIHHSLPTLGYPGPDVANDPSGGAKGWGLVQPKTIFNGGDPTGRLTGITWASWGDPKAVGRGRGYYVSPSESVAKGSLARARVVAFKLGTCNGHRAYTAVEWFFPGKGQTFDPKHYETWCNGLGFMPGDPPPSN